jgi:tRNA nucleotidyltransferase/poly(A) polymerase
VTVSVSRRLPDDSWLSSGPLAQLLAVLDRAGEEARVVGGAVRNCLLGEQRGDIDIATTALPDEVLARARAVGFKAVPTGIDHGTVTVIVDDTPFEVTTLRADVETFGRKAKVMFGRSWRIDAERRDFTMNALSVTPRGELYDYVGGLADLDARVVRFIGDPRRRITEDYLRILRFFRFHAAYGRGEPDAAGVAASIAEREGVAGLSRERVHAELMKLLVAPGAAPTLAIMADAGLLGSVLGGVPLVSHFARMAAIETALGLSPDAPRRLGALAVMVEEDGDRLWQRLRLTNGEHQTLLSMADGWRWLSPTIGEAKARELLYRLRPACYLDRVLLAWARSSAAVDDPQWVHLATLPQRWPLPACPIKSKAFTARGIAKGPQLGVALKAAEEAWIAAGFPNGRQDLDAITDAAARAGNVTANAAE